MKYKLTFLVDVPEGTCALTLMQDMIQGYRAIPIVGRAVYLTVKDMDWKVTDQSNLLPHTEENQS